MIFIRVNMFYLDFKCTHLSIFWEVFTYLRIVHLFTKIIKKQICIHRPPLFCTYLHTFFIYYRWRGFTFTDSFSICSHIILRRIYILRPQADSLCLSIFFPTVYILTLLLCALMYIIHYVTGSPPPPPPCMLCSQVCYL